MTALLEFINLRSVLLGILVLAYLVVRLLGFRIGPSKWNRWFWGESSNDNKPRVATPNSH